MWEKVLVPDLAMLECPPCPDALGFVQKTYPHTSFNVAITAKRFSLPRVILRHTLIG